MFISGVTCQLMSGCSSEPAYIKDLMVLKILILDGIKGGGCLCQGIQFEVGRLAALRVQVSLSLIFKLNQWHAISGDKGRYDLNGEMSRQSPSGPNTMQTCLAGVLGVPK